MSPASRSKPKDKSSTKTAKDQKSSSKASAPGNAGAGAPASAYNPLLGTFHNLETAAPVSSPPPHSNGRFQNIDETDEQSGSLVGTGAEYDSVSNNDSCSGESEDLKEKMTGTTLRQETIPGSDNDKREKIRQKNERKHQRQRERRAQELHDRCNGYLMSRKLEALAQQLVAMGFSSERATMALIANEGRIEESVAWLLEGGEEAAQQKDSSNLTGVNLKIDITEELSHIVDLESKYKCSKQEVERAIVACEGDLEKASDNLKAQKQDPAVSTPKIEEAGEPSAVNGGKMASVSITQNPLRPPAKPTASITIQQRRDERDFNYTKASPTVLASPESAMRTLQASRRNLPKPEWSRPQVTTPPPADKRWLNSGSNPSVSYSLTPPLQVAIPAKPEAQARFVVVGSEVKNLPTGGTVREPLIMMQRPQSINSKQNNTPPAAISASPPGTAGWYPNSVPNVEIMKSNAGLSFVPSTRSLDPTNNLTSHQFHQQLQYQPFVSSSPVDSAAAAAAGWGGSGSWSTTGNQTSSSLAVPSSLGLFSGWGSSGGSGSSSPVDWSTGGSMPQCDYTNIDWSLESTAGAGSSSSKSNGWWLDLASLMKNSRMYDSWSLANQSAGSNPSTPMRSANPNGGGLYNAGLQEGLATMTDNTSSQVPSSPPSTSNVGGGNGPPQHEWTSPFAGQDIFSIPRQFVTSPSL